MDIEYLASTLFCKTCHELNTSFTTTCDKCKASKAGELIYEDEDDFSLFRQNIYEDIKLKWLPFLETNFVDFAFKSYALFLSRTCVHAAQNGFRESSFELYLQRVLRNINILNELNQLKRELSAISLLTLYSISYYSYIVGMMNFSMIESYYNPDDYTKVYDLIISQIVPVPGDLPCHYLYTGVKSHRSIGGEKMLRFVCIFLCKNTVVDTSDLYNAMY